jgi:hypothetical protein
MGSTNTEASEKYEQTVDPRAPSGELESILARLDMLTGLEEAKARVISQVGDRVLGELDNMAPDCLGTDGLEKGFPLIAKLQIALDKLETTSRTTATLIDRLQAL